MKRIIPLSLVVATSIFASNVVINTGWNLVGAVTNIAPSSINCAKTVWAYDNDGWKLYTNGNYALGTPSSYGYNELTNINQGQGFWVDSACADSIDFADSSSSSMFNIFNRDWKIANWDERYTSSGNTIVPNGDKVTLTTVRRDDQESRSEMITYLNSTASSASGAVKITGSSTEYNRLKFRTYSDVTLDDNTKLAYGFSSNDVRAMCSINISGKKIYATIYLEDENNNGTTIYNSKDPSLGGGTINDMYYNPNNSDLIGKDLNVSIVNSGDTVTFSASTTGLDIGSVSFTRPTGVSSKGINAVAVRTEINDKSANDDSYEAGYSITAEVYNVSVALETAKLDITTESTIDVINWSNITNAIEIKQENHDLEYSKWNILPSTFSMNEYEYENNAWSSIESFTGTVTPNPNDDSNISIAESAGFKADLIITKTERITQISGVTALDNIYISDVEFHITNPGEGWTETWDWENPNYYDGSSHVAINTVDQLIAGYTTSNMSYNDGLFLEAGGSITQGNYTGMSNDGHEMYERNSVNVIQDASWSKSNEKLVVETANEINKLDVILDNGNYFIQSEGNDKNGSIIYNQIITTNNPNVTVENLETTVQNLLNNQN